MKLINKSLIAALVSAAPLSLVAQEAGHPAPGEGPRRFVSPIFVVLDANQDGQLDASEIANAAQALLTLDTDGDGQLTAEELRPARPEGGPGPGGPGGKRGSRPVPRQG